MAKKNCVICGKEGYSYFPFCYEHLQEKNVGKIAKCEDCGTWHYADKHCEKCEGKGNLQEQAKQYTRNGCEMWTVPDDENPWKRRTVDIIDNAKVPTSELRCIICGEPSNGKHFCISCYNKYRERSIDIRISNCNSVQILDEYGSKTKKAKDGRYVRSLSEKIIIDYFFDNYIRVVYEKTIPYINDKGENKELHPDFYLTDYNLYIEFNGLTNKEYLKKKEYANKIYRDKGLNVEILEADDINDIEATMQILLDKYKNHR